MAKYRKLIGCALLPGTCNSRFCRFAWSYVAVVAIDICLRFGGYMMVFEPVVGAIFRRGRGKKKSEYASTADSGPAIRHC